MRGREGVGGGGTGRGDGGGGRGWHPVVVTQACFVEVCTCWWLRRLLFVVAAAGAKLVRVSLSLCCKDAFTRRFNMSKL